MREYPCPSLPRRSASSKCAHSASVSSAEKPSAPSRVSPSSRSIRLPAELEHGPAALGRDTAKLTVGIDGDSVTDQLEERDVRVRVGVRRAGSELVTARLRELAHARCLVLGV